MSSATSSRRSSPGSAKATGWKANWPVYSPNSNATMVPFQNGVPASPLTIPNLVSRSVSASNTGGTNPYKAYPTGATLYTAASVPPSRAALDSSASGAFAGSKVSSAAPSLNGRSVSVAQWNAPYLIPSAQLASFVPPDWVVVTRAGANAVNWSSGSGGLNDPTVTNNNYAVGRYAYAVYNEGGLLDMNVAGYPSGLTTAQTSNKSSLALADLTQVGSHAIADRQHHRLAQLRHGGALRLLRQLQPVHRDGRGQLADQLRPRQHERLPADHARTLRRHHAADRPGLRQPAAAHLARAIPRYRHRLALLPRHLQPRARAAVLHAGPEPAEDRQSGERAAGGQHCHQLHGQQR
ncbi:MAG: hypothetical protein WDO13_08520 [Verrucomicrobiota bacterium]